MSIDKVFKGHELFRSLSIDEINKLSNFSSLKKYDVDESIFKINGAGTHLYMLMKGVVYLRLPANPPEYGFIIAKIEKGEIFGLSPLLNSPRYTSSAQCVEPVEVLAIEAKPFSELLLGNHDVSINVMRQVAQIYFSRYIDLLKNIQGVISQVSLTH
ncbi:MAG: cyclic nucleotide-binding domain-containing protein [candidate division Zixibacteria bacterium]|nr:cyclic nucleotide-binding domain-containing protein [candidate division Zixibacteria bacterium]